MHCRICGETEGIEYYQHKRQSLCKHCAKDTPKKMGRLDFDQKYWGRGWQEVPNSTRSEFYSDYLASSDSFAKYVDNTTSEVM